MLIVRATIVVAKVIPNNTDRKLNFLKLERKNRPYAIGQDRAVRLGPRSFPLEHTHHIGIGPRCVVTQVVDLSLRVLSLPIEEA